MTTRMLIVNALITTAPAYAATLFVDELTSGDLVDAVGLPIAGLFGLGSIAAGFELAVMLEAAVSIADDFQGLISF